MKRRCDRYLTTYAEGPHYKKGLLETVFARVDSFESGGTGSEASGEVFRKKNSLSKLNRGAIGAINRGITI